MAKKIKYSLNNEEFYKSFLAGKKPEEGRLFISGGKTHDGVMLVDEHNSLLRAIRPRAGQVVLMCWRYSAWTRCRKYIKMYGPKKLRLVESKAVWNPRSNNPSELSTTLFDDVVRHARNDGNMTHGDACLLYNQILRDIDFQQYLTIPVPDKEEDD